MVLLLLTNLERSRGKMESPLDSDLHESLKVSLRKKKSPSSLWFIDTMMGISNPSALKSWWFQGWTVFEV